MYNPHLPVPAFYKLTKILPLRCEPLLCDLMAFGLWPTICGYLPGHHRFVDEDRYEAPLPLGDEMHLWQRSKCKWCGLTMARRLDI